MCFQHGSGQESCSPIVHILEEVSKFLKVGHTKIRDSCQGLTFCLFPGAGQYIRGRAMSMTQSGAEISQMGKAKMQSGMAKIQGPVETNTGGEMKDGSATQSASPRESNPLSIASGKGIKPGAKANSADAVESSSPSSSPSTQRPAFRFKSDLKPKLRTTTSEREFESRLPVK